MSSSSEFDLGLPDAELPGGDSTSSPLDELEQQLRELEAPTSAEDAFAGLEEETGFDLDDLLTESIQHQASSKAQAKEVREARKTLRTPKRLLSKEKVEELSMKLLTWESQREWKTLTQYVVFVEHTCECCGSIQSHYSHLSLYQEHAKNLCRGRRWVRATPDVIAVTIPGDAPKKVAVIRKNQPLCNACASAAGWDMSDPQTYGEN